MVTIALLCSWLLALTMTPLLAVTFLKVKANPRETRYDTRFLPALPALLLGGLRRPWLALAARRRPC